MDDYLPQPKRRLLGRIEETRGFKTDAPAIAWWRIHDILGHILSFVSDAIALATFATAVSKDVSRQVFASLRTIDVRLPSHREIPLDSENWHNQVSQSCTEKASKFIELVLQKCAPDRIRHLTMRNVGCSLDAIISQLHAATKGAISIRILTGVTTCGLTYPVTMKKPFKRKLNWPNLRSLKVPISRSMNTLRTIDAPLLEELSICIVGCRLNKPIDVTDISIISAVKILYIDAVHGVAGVDVVATASAQWESVTIKNPWFKIRPRLGADGAPPPPDVEQLANLAHIRLIYNASYNRMNWVTEYPLRMLQTLTLSVDRISQFSMSALRQKSLPALRLLTLLGHSFHETVANDLRKKCLQQLPGLKKVKIREPSSR